MKLVIELRYFWRFFLAGLTDSCIIARLIRTGASAGPLLIKPGLPYPLKLAPAAWS
jgi:hypothetical protein